MTFQVLDLKRCQFFELCDEDNNPLELSYAKEGVWFKYFRHSNSLCARAMRAIINYMVNIGWDFSLGRISAVYTVTILLKLGIIFSMNVESIMSIGIQGETQ